MPKLTTIVVTVDGTPHNFVPSQNSGETTSWLINADTLGGGTTAVYNRRNVTSNQTTRKSALTFTTPLESVCEQTCSVQSRGSILFKLDAVSSKDSTLEERTLAFELLQGLLDNEDIKDAFINNGAFYS